MHIVDFHKFAQEIPFMALCLHSAHQAPSEKGSTLKGKRLSF